MGRFRRGAAALMAAVFSIAVAHAGSPDLTVKQMEDSLAHKGATATLATYFDCDTGTGWKLVSSGDAGAVKVGFALFPKAHGCQAELMTAAFSHALTSNPTQMMGYLNSRSDVSTELCTPLLNNPTKAELAAAFDAAKRAYMSVTDPLLAKIKQACLAKLEESRAQMLP